MTGLVNPNGYPRRVWTLETVRDRCEEVGDCWLWAQGVNGTGYPQASIDGKQGMSVRTYVYDKLLARKRPAASSIVSLCDNRLCCSPLCLVPRSRSKIIAEQWADGKRTGAAATVRLRAQAVAQGLSKLTADQVAAIRALPQPINRTAVAREHGVHPKTISNLLTGHSWAAPRRPTSSIFNLAEAV